MDREHVEARLREIAASADATSTAAETLLRELQAVPEEGAVAHPDESAARLVAMKLALDGVPRDEAVKRISTDFEVANPQSLVEDVYARADA